MVQGSEKTRRCLKRAVPVGAILFLFVILAFQALRKTKSEWMDVYVRAGQQWWAGLDIYGSGSAYLYPPFQAAVAAPFAALPEWVARLGWFAMSVASMLVMVGVAWRLAGGGRLQDMLKQEGREWLVFAVGLACSFSYVLNAFAHQQTDVAIGALLMGGAWYLAGNPLGPGREAAGGALLGIAAGCKATPLLWLPYLLLRRRLIAASVLGTAFLAVNLLPEFIPAPGGEWRMVQWLGHIVLPSQNLDISPGNWGSSLEYNQSLGGTLQRLVNTSLEMTSRGPEMRLSPRVSGAALKLIVYGLYLALIAVSIAAVVRAGHDRSDGSGRLESQILEFSMVLILMLLTSPMSSRAHFGILILPAFCLGRIAAATRDWLIGTILAVVAVLTLGANKDLVGSFAHGIGLWVGVTTGCTLLLWAGCVYALCFGLRRAPQ